MKILHLISRFCILLLLYPTANAQTIKEVSGEINQNTVWSDDIIKLMGDVTVADDITLTNDRDGLDKGIYIIELRGDKVYRGKMGVE